MGREALLVRTFVELADSLVADFDVVELLSRLTERCVEVLGVSAAGVMLVAPEGDLRVVASSSEAMRVVELFEVQSDEGPCPDCYRSGEAVICVDLAAVNGRWGRFGPVAMDAGFVSVLALPMRLRGLIIGAVNLFASDAGAMDDDNVVVCQALADVATIAILQQRAAVDSRTVVDQLNHALTSRVVIEQAKGVVAERSGVTMEAAFEAIRAYARGNNLLLADIARSIADKELAPAALGVRRRPVPKP